MSFTYSGKAVQAPANRVIDGGANASRKIAGMFCAELDSQRSADQKAAAPVAGTIVAVRPEQLQPELRAADPVVGKGPPWRASPIHGDALSTASWR